MKQPLDAGGPSAWLTMLMAAATGLVVANMYYAQPLVGLIGPEIGLSEGAASLVVTVTQIGYAIALLLAVPLADRIENRRLIVVTVLFGVGALFATSLARSGPVFLVAAGAIGLTSVSVQMIVPLAAHLAAPEARGRVVGNVMAGLLVGILLARPAASFIAFHFGWRSVFVAAALAQLLLAALLWRALPVRRPAVDAAYGRLLASLWPLMRDNPALQRRCFYQACLFAAFTLFWTAVPLHLAGPTFRLDQDGIGLFALCGAAGALAAPVAGRVADRGWLLAATLVAILGATISFAAGGLLGASLVGLAVVAILLDGAVQFHHITAQRVIYSLAPEIRGRVTALYMASLFVGGAMGSAFASPVLLRFGWHGVAALGTAFGLFALAAVALHRLRDRRAA